MFLDGGVKLRRTAVSNVNYTVSTSDHIIAYTSLSAARTVTLPDASLVSGVTFVIKDESGSAGTYAINIVTASGVIDGLSSKTLNVAYGSLRFYSNGSNWFSLV